MSFIFRAYHAMQRSRPMSTRSGLPTAAAFVFVNMITKLRKDFAPHYFAAVFDVSGAVFRDAKAQEIGTLRRWSSKEKAFVETTYEGYKAQRTAMPEDLARQLPYIRRSLEVLHIPILQAEGFEADDVIGTLARQACEQGHEVFIVSGDKDMMQLVSDHVSVLNPQKDNLIIDPAKVIEILGVPAHQVIDVMALRGDSIDNIPGAPGIGDKGSVELIQQYGSVEATLDHADEIKRKTYRESLQQNRETVLLSKELVTIDCHVPLDLNLDQMQTTEPDLEAARELFTELEFTSLLRELAPGAQRPTAELIDDPSEEQIAAFYKAARQHGFALALEKDAKIPKPTTSADAVEEDLEEESLPPMQSLLDMMEAASPSITEAVNTAPSPEFLGVSVKVDSEPELALRLTLNDNLRALLEDEKVSKIAHDFKAALHKLTNLGVSLAGPVTDTMLLSYAVNPTHSAQTLVDVVARSGQGVPTTLAGAAHAVQSLVPSLRKQVEEHQGRPPCTKTIDLPLVPVLYRHGRRSASASTLGALDELSQRFGSEIQRVSERYL